MKNFSAYALFVGMILVSLVYTDDVFAQSEIAISAGTDKNLYKDGDKIIVSGAIENFDSETHSNIALTYRVTDPEEGIVSLGQVSPNSKGDFSFDFDAGGSFFNQNGEYSVHLFFESSSKKISFSYDGTKDSNPQPQSESNLNNNEITVTLDGPSTIYFDSPSHIIRASVEIENFTPSDGQYFMKVTHIPTQKVLKDFEIYPKALGNDVWGVEIAYPILESDIKLGGQKLIGEFEIHVRTEFDSQTGSTTFSIVGSKKDLPIENRPETEKQIDPPSLELDAGTSDSSEQEIPDWVKTNAEWWANDRISESEFISSVEYLLENEIMKITLTKNDDLPSIVTIYTLPDSRSTEYVKITGEFSEKHQGALTLTIVKPDKSEENITTFSRDGSFMTTMELTENSLVGTYQVFAEIEGNQILTSTFEVKDTDGRGIPSWIKNNAEWWAQDLITDDDFVKGIQYLIEQGIIKI